MQVCEKWKRVQYEKGELAYVRCLLRHHLRHAPIIAWLWIKGASNEIVLRKGRRRLEFGKKEFGLAWGT